MKSDMQLLFRLIFKRYSFKQEKNSTVNLAAVKSLGKRGRSEFLLFDRSNFNAYSLN